MGRITPSFRQIYHQLMEQIYLRNNSFYHTLKDPEHRKAFALLVRNAWSAENAAMGNSGIPCITDIMNLMANVHVRKCILELENQLRELEDMLQKAQKGDKTQREEKG